MFRRRSAPSEETPEARPLAPGVVTRLVAQKKDPLRVSVYLDGAFAFGIHQDVLVQHGLRKGQALGVAEQQAMRSDDARLRLRQTALSFLSHRARTREEVRRKLAGPDVPADAIEETLAWLTERSYLDDEVYARQYAESRARAGGYGPQRIRQELMRRGVARETIDAALAEELEDEGVAEAARQQAEKRWTQLAREPDPHKRRRKLSDFLVRRGYPYDVVAAVVEAVCRDEDS